MANAKNEDFILCGPETITLKALSALVAEAEKRRLSRIHIPLGFARMVASTIDIATYRGLFFEKKEPPINNEKLDVMTVPISFCSEKAQKLLGYAPRVAYREGVARTLGQS